MAICDGSVSPSTRCPIVMRGGGCSTIGTVQLLDVGVPTTNLGAMRCGLGRSLCRLGPQRRSARRAPDPWQRSGQGRDVRHLRMPRDGRYRDMRTFPAMRSPTRSTSPGSISPTDGGSASSVIGASSDGAVRQFLQTIHALGLQALRHRAQPRLQRRAPEPPASRGRSRELLPLIRGFQSVTYLV